MKNDEMKRVQYKWYITKVKQLSFLNMKEMETKMINAAEMLIKMF